MSRFHVHIAVDDLDKNIEFYSAIFGAKPTVLKPNYAKWALDDPKVNFAISTRGRKVGLDHVGIQADSDDELKAVRQRIEQAGITGLSQEGTTCCYTKSDKYWVQDPQGIAWESFHSLGEAPMFGGTIEQDEEGSACCAPNVSSCC
jgi:catechol 2,3-dioxygenase-like lactoylglutathione lyase family enzyme